jgi:hypothetical protein
MRKGEIPSGDEKSISAETICPRCRFIWFRSSPVKLTESAVESTGRPVSNENPFGVLSFDLGCCGSKALIALSMNEKKTRKLTVVVVPSPAKLSVILTVRAQELCVMTITFLRSNLPSQRLVGCSCSATRTSRIQHGECAWQSFGNKRPGMYGLLVKCSA